MLQVSVAIAAAHRSPLPTIIVRPLNTANGAFNLVTVVDAIVCAVNWLASIVTIA